MEPASEETAGFTIVVQAGGESRRMGMDKGLVEFMGQPLVERVLHRVTDLADEILVTTNNLQGYRFLGVPLVADLLPGQGALAGLYTALGSASCSFVGVVACDMPFVSPAMLSAQRDLLIDSNTDLVIPKTPQGLEPFHAVYRRSACLPAVKSALEAGKRRVDAWFPQVKLRYLTQLEIRLHDPLGWAFFNINTPADLQKAEKAAG
jgi:molybdopterin-guanine dinucleotide biosynthesis protein A